jgi:hypothetical protein
MAHQVHLRMTAAARRQRALVGGMCAGLGAAAYAWAGCVTTWLVGLLPVPRWRELAFGVFASGIVCAVVRSRAAVREADELRQFAETARRGAEGDWKALEQTIASSELRRTAAVVGELVRAGEAEREQLSRTAAELEGDLRRLTEEMARRIADLESAASHAAVGVRESALMVHATANLLARDSGGRLDATGRERLEQLRLHAEAVDQRLRGWLDGSVRMSDSPARGVAAGGGNGRG